MKVYQTNEIRNLTLLGNAGAGKTTLAETMLYEGGVVNRMGEVENKNTASDYHQVEQEYGNSVHPTVLYTEYNGCKLNIIDTPGMDDFVGGVIPALSVAATGLMVFNTVNGVEVGTEIANRNAEKFHTPLIFVMNHLNHENTNWDMSIDSAKAAFGNKLAIVQYPVNPGVEFNKVIDVLKMKMYEWPANGGKAQIVDIPEEEKEKAEQMHNELVEMAAENDEDLMELFFEKGELTEDEMRTGLKLGMLDRSVFPVFCTCASCDMGSRRLMEFIINVAPHPGELAPRKTVDDREVKADTNGPTSLFVFKTSVEQHVGEITYFKVMSGTVKEGMDLINTTRDAKERISQIYAVAGKNRTKVTEMVAGDIGATVKLKETKHNHTLSDKDANYKFPPLQYPEPRYRTAIKAVNEADEEKMGEYLHRMSEEDPTYVVEYSKELKQVIVHGQGEYHLNTLKWYFNNIFKIDIEYLKPKIPYRETITKAAQADYRHKKQSGGAGQFGEVHMIIEPFEEGMPAPSVYKIDGKEWKVSLRGTEEHKLSWGGKLVFCNCIVGGSIDARFHPAILKGIMEKMEEGPLTGSYARDIRVCIYDGKMHPVDSNEISFKLAGRNAFSQAFKKAGAKILEPIYDVEVLVPSDRMGDVMSDLQGRRALIMGMSSEKGFEKIVAKVPLKEMDRYSTALSSLTQGRAMFTMKFAGYEKVPGEIQEELLAAYEAEQNEE
ncbi:translation factor GTPase family protein [Prolixibacter sp. NT017]|uniref:elongation factor G n=1 Tax=Prolixibacter sp. NT017 TaxID=2652390 RepID=UPI00126E17FB|nr:elongation factor G [Prolixibacter sp. NT017]GET26525.1 elongation factor G [Prolixibacter sp. NT017]